MENKYVEGQGECADSEIDMPEEEDNETPCKSKEENDDESEQRWFDEAQVIVQSCWNRARKTDPD